MNKEALVALGLTDEQADKVIAGYGQMIPKSRLDDKIQEVKDLNEQITDRDKQLTELKKVDAKGLQDKITELETANKTAKTEYDQKLKDTQLSSALKLALTGKVHDTDIVADRLDKTKLELDENGNISKGLDDQLKELQTSKSFLFVPETTGTPPIKGAKPPVEGNPPANPNSINAGAYGKQMAENLAKSTQGLDQARKSYFD